MNIDHACKRREGGEMETEKEGVRGGGGGEREGEGWGGERETERQRDRETERQRDRDGAAGAADHAALPLLAAVRRRGGVLAGPAGGLRGPGRRVRAPRPDGHGGWR